VRPGPRSGRRRRDRPQAGFTLLEVMFAILLAMVGLLGTLAVQQTLLNANAQANDGGIALKLASQALEELNVRVVQPGNPAVDRMQAIATGTWSAPVFLDAAGRPSATLTGLARWQRRIRVTNLGFAQPYNVSVEVRYALDTGNPKIFQLDQERRK
jgi:Tfp pilus assembly protein PilV